MMTAPSRARAYPTRGVVRHTTDFHAFIRPDDILLIHYFCALISSTFFSGATGEHRNSTHQATSLGCFCAASGGVEAGYIQRCRRRAFPHTSTCVSATVISGHDLPPFFGQLSRRVRL
jgi:hypothetical protein